MTKLLRYGVCIALFCFAAMTASAQQVQFNYYYKFEPAMITEPPTLGGLEVAYPEAARKLGIEGTVKVSGTLGEDGKVRDVAIMNDLGHGTGAAVAAGLQGLHFKPASYLGKPAAMKLTIEYVVSMYYDENDKNITKPKIVDKPLPPYPASQRAAGMKGKVMVRVLFMASGEVKVLGASSVMERDFDKAAQDA
ncbi:MAG TPA: TonB family protein, partial [Pyrinomonadaceae bacterium]|nr:TonB family protein [Pyrinomonadaceae bacterium]